MMPPVAAAGLDHRAVGRLRGEERQLRPAVSRIARPVERGTARGLEAASAGGAGRPILGAPDPEEAFARILSSAHLPFLRPSRNSEGSA